MSQSDDSTYGLLPLSPDTAAPAVGASPDNPRDSLVDLAMKYGVPAIDLTQVAIVLQDLDLVPKDVAERHLILPVSVREDRMYVAMANPNDKRAIEELEFVTGKRLARYVAPPRLLARVIDAAYQAKLRGADHYTGPNCPPETLARVSSMPPVTQRPPPPAPVTPSRSNSVVASMQGLTNELSDDGFGMLSADLSTVTDLSVLGRLAQTQGTAVTFKATILIVDDDVETRRLLSRVLSEKGYRVIEADRGLVALRLVKEHTPDLIVLDAMLPEIHGFDIARRIKGSRKYGHLPIVMMSAVHRGWRYAEDIKASCGVSEYVEKPFRLAEVMDVIERALSSARSGTGSAETEAAVSAAAEQALAEGIAAYRAGDLETAIAHLRRGVGIDPLAYRLHFHLGLLLGKRGLVYDAIHALETAMGINPRHFPALKNLAVLYQQAGFRNKAIETWERALAVVPDDETRRSIKEHLMSLL